MVFKFINEGKREHEEMSAFIREFRTTNELLFKERNNSLSKLRFEVYGLSKVINNALISECEGKGVTTRGGKMTTQGILNENTKIRDKEPSVFVHDKLDAPKEVLVKNEPQKGKEQVVQPSIKVQTSLIPFPRRLRKEKKESQQRQFLENLKQLYINLLFIEALAQMPKYAKFMKCLLTNKARLQEACTVMMNERSMEPKPTRMSLELVDRARDDEVIFNVDQSIKRPAAEDDECYGIDDLDKTINVETRELLGNNQLDSFLLKDLEKSINLADLESCDSIGDQSSNDFNLGTPIRRIDPVLEKCKGAISWKMTDMKGMSLSFCTHKILMNDDFKPIIQPQRRLNPKVQYVLKNKIVKLLDSGLIYHISDSLWVSPIHVVPKKGGMTVVLNDNNELISSRTVNGWQVCINYRKLNDATRKDHFPLPFIDQMLERLSGNEY
ncbi:hypothetical protein Tco_1231828 [Tanacetum coccineum]